MPSAHHGMLQQLEILTQKLNYLRKEYAIASDAGVKFTLQMQIAELEKEIESINERLTAFSKNESKPTMPTENPYDRILNLLKKSWFVALILLIFLLVTKGNEFLEAWDGIQKRFDKNAKDTVVQTLPLPVDTIHQTDIIKNPTTPVVRKSKPKPAEPPAPAPKIVFVRLFVNAEFSKAAIFANGKPVAPVKDDLSIKQLELPYDGQKTIELRLKTPQNECKKTFTVPNHYFDNPITIEVSCSN
jgi:uncharacterized membrane protein